MYKYEKERQYGLGKGIKEGDFKKLLEKLVKTYEKIDIPEISAKYREVDIVPGFIKGKGGEIEIKDFVTITIGKEINIHYNCLFDSWDSMKFNETDIFLQQKIIDDIAHIIDETKDLLFKELKSEDIIMINELEKAKNTHNKYHSLETYELVKFVEKTKEKEIERKRKKIHKHNKDNEKYSYQLRELLDIKRKLPHSMKIYKEIKDIVNIKQYPYSYQGCFKKDEDNSSVYGGTSYDVIRNLLKKMKKIESSSCLIPTNRGKAIVKTDFLCWLDYIGFPRELYEELFGEKIKSIAI